GVFHEGRAGRRAVRGQGGAGREEVCHEVREGRGRSRRAEEERMSRRGHISDSDLLIIGHRGASGYAPENTLASFDLAFEEGADGIEFDVRLARDGVPVVIHDASLLRTVQLERMVEEFDSTLLSQFYAGEWYNARYPKFARESFAWERIP